MTTSDFDRAGLYTTLATIEARLADLSYIDHVVDLRDRFYEDSGHSGGPFGIAEDLLGTDIPVGREHPFEISVYGLLGGSKLNAQLSEDRSNAQSWASGRVDAVRAAIPTLVDPRAELLAQSFDQLHGPAHTLDTVVPGILNKIRTNLGDWQGQAKHSFDTFIGDAERAIMHQAWLTESIRVALAQAKAVVDMGQVGLQDALNQVSDDLDQQLRFRQEEARGAERKIDFWLFAGTVTGVVGSLALPGVGQLAVLAASSPVLGMVKDKIPEQDGRFEGVNVRRAGDYADKLDLAVRNIADGTRARWDTAATEGAGQIEVEAARLGSLHDGVGFEPPVPSMAQGPVDPGDFTNPAQGR